MEKKDSQNDNHKDSLGLLSVFRTSSVPRNIAVFGKSSSKAPEIFEDPNEAVNAQLSGDSLLRIMHASKTQDNDRFIALTEKGDHAGVEQMLRETKFDLKGCQGLHGYTPLHHACSRNQSPIVSILLKHGVDVNVTNHAGESPLHLASYSGNLLVVEQLIDCGANVDAINKDGETALFYAARQCRPAVVRLLLQRHANSRIKDRFDDTALDQAGDERTKNVILDIVCNDNENSSSMNNNRSSGGVDTTLSPAMRVPYTELLRVFEFLDAKDVCRAAMVCGKWHRVSETEELWRSLGIRRWEMALQSTLGLEGFEPIGTSFLSRPSRSNNKPNSRSGSR